MRNHKIYAFFLQSSESAAIRCFSVSTLFIILQHSVHFWDWKNPSKIKSSLNSCVWCFGLLEWLYEHWLDFCTRGCALWPHCWCLSNKNLSVAQGSHSLALDLASNTAFQKREGKSKGKTEKKKELPGGPSFLIIETTTNYPCLVYILRLLLCQEFCHLFPAGQCGDKKRTGNLWEIKYTCALRKWTLIIFLVKEINLFSVTNHLEDELLQCSSHSWGLFVSFI